ncbi:lamin tail domain-containing protein [Roseovarius aestuarii]|uniref:lamin tail domain-containing protein n=1 Tax=Roseovarius aestuarii TaxID=475083 RepID=UPI001593AB9B|nr:lamin tail domain-containing protein [Roseovarius aestuarii]
MAKREISIFSAMIRPRSPETGKEWVSLLNRTEDEINLNGWVMRSKNGRKAVLQGRVGPGRMHMIGGADIGTLRLGNQGEDLMLRKADNVLVDHVTWTREALLRGGPGIFYEFELGR